MSMRGVALTSGGIDSPVAVHIMMERGYEISCVFFDNTPYTDEKTRRRTLLTVKRIKDIHKKKIQTFVVPNGENLSAFFKVCGREGRNLTCIFCRRMMFKIAEKVAESTGAAFLITGENLGQVASQTSTNIFVTSRAVTIPIIRPLIGLDKLDIIEIAQKIGTYTISIQKAVCCYATPKYPAIRASLEKIEDIERRINMRKLVERAVETMEVIE